MTKKKDVRLRGGRLSKKDWAFIESNVGQKSVDDMANILQKSPDSIKNYIQKKLHKPISVFKEDEANAVYDLTKSEYWPEIQKQFDEGEQAMFLKIWSEIATQFSETDIYSTEKIQIMDVIKLQILMDRNLKAENQHLKNTKEMEANLTELKRLYQEVGDDDKSDLRFRIQELENQLQFAYTSQESFHKSYNNLLDEKNKLWKHLRATRADRVKEIEQARQSFPGWMAEIIRNRGMRKELGERMEKQRLAMEQEYQRLGQYHEYGFDDEKEIDRPILNSSTVEWET